MQKILITGWNWMLATDFKKLFKNKYNIFSFDKNDLNITDFDNIQKVVNYIKPDIILNFAAYTKVDDAEDIWRMINYNVNTLWVYNLSKISNRFWVDFITISTDYVFDGTKEKWYNENDKKNPINQYWVAKHLGEELAKKENKNSIIIRTSWLYWWWKDYKNFVNTMLSLWKKLDSLKVVNDQFWNPTYTVDLSNAIWKIIDNIENHRWKIFHFSNETKWNWITWYEFAKEIFSIAWIKIDLQACASDEFPTRAQRPKYSKLINNSDIKLRNWKEWLKEYLNSL